MASFLALLMQAVGQGPASAGHRVMGEPLRDDDPFFEPAEVKDIFTGLLISENRQLPRAETPAESSTRPLGPPTSREGAEVPHE